MSPTNQCENPQFRVYSFSEELIRDISEQYARQPDNQKAKKLYGDGTISYYIDPNLPDYIKTSITAHLGKLDTLFPGLSFVSSSDPKQTSPDLTFTSYHEEDYNNPQMSEGVAATNIGIKETRFNLKALESEKAIGESIGDPLYMQKLLEQTINHELTHFFGINHSDLSSSNSLKEISQFFQASDMGVIGNFDNKDQGKPVDLLTKVIAPLDMYILSQSMADEPTFFQRLLGAKAKERELDYLDYYRLTGNLLEPQVGPDRIAHINLGQWALDQDVLIFEMPGKKDLAIMTSTGFVVIPGILGDQYAGFDITISEPNGALITKSNINTPVGGITLENMHSSLSSILNTLPDNWKEWARSYNAMQFQDRDVLAQNGSMPTLDWWEHYCTTTSKLEETDHVTLMNTLDQTSIVKQLNKS